MKRFLLYLVLLLGLLIVIFLIQNADPVELNFLLWTFTTRRAFVVLLMLFIGMFSGWVLGRPGRRKRKEEIAVAAEPASGPPPAQPPVE